MYMYTSRNMPIRCLKVGHVASYNINIMLIAILLIAIILIAIIFIAIILIAIIWACRIVFQTFCDRCLARNARVYVA